MIKKIIVLCALSIINVCLAFEVTVINKTGFDIEITRIMPPLSAKDGKSAKIIGKKRTLQANKSVKLFAKHHGLADLSVQGIYKHRKIGPQSVIHSISKTGFTGKQTIEIYYSDKLKKFYYKKIA